jgi:hypothetical protein
LSKKLSEEELSSAGRNKRMPEKVSKWLLLRDDLGDDLEAIDRYEAQSRKLKRRWDALCGTKQELVDSAKRETNAENRSSLIEIKDIDAKILELSKERQKLDEENSVKRRRIEVDYESDVEEDDEEEDINIGDDARREKATKKKCKKLDDIKYEMSILKILEAKEETKMTTFR